MSSLTLLFVQAAVIIALSRLLGVAGRRLGQPQVIAEVIAGILLGPSLLGWLWPAATATLFPASSVVVLGLLSQLGLVIFMFLVGLELDLSRIEGRAAVAISQASIVLPFGLGAGAAVLLYPRLSPPSVPLLSFALFMGIAMSITAFPVLARILAERGLTGTKVGAVAIACAAVDDVTGWCLLAVVTAIVRRTGLQRAALTIGLAAAFVVVLFCARPLLARLGRRAIEHARLPQRFVALVLLLLLGASAIAEPIGIHALFGAFMLGVVMPKDAALVRGLSEKLEDLVTVLLLPLFFAYSGLRTQLGLIDSAAAWGTFALILALACLGKFGGSTVAARLSGLSWREASTIGLLMNTRGLMELVVLNIGLDLGVISPTLFTMMVMMALVTTMLTGPGTSWIYPPARRTA